ncbi:MAG: succinyl-diaminopimelate desuccinylase [Novosphingopyxis baekryungensis]|jgi:succinyl-diaminopimelate desuccinylase|nr:succinyl-diaminopimelate desuccinylase [Novosphingopyxis baekryungensis]
METKAVTDVTHLTRQLIACESVTPATGAVFDAMEAMLAPLGFTISRFVAGEAPDGPVENLYATRGSGGRHFAFAGHLDVVPAGKGWTGSAFDPDERDGLLYGRGAVDMKGSIAAFVAAIGDIPEDAGRISLIITGDEEGPAVFGTRALMDFMAERSIVPDLCLVGEPTSVNTLGDMMKIGRRGSVNMWITVTGTQGHVAYPHNADNPIPRLCAIMSELEKVRLDNGTDWFQASNLEVTDLTVGNEAHNVIPGEASARLSIRFNDRHTGDGLVRMVRSVAELHGGTVEAIVSGEPFLTPPGDFSAIIAAAITEVTGVEPELSTSGGTSDARFLSKLCPVVEFGLRNATMHKLDEAVEIADLEALVEIYRRIVRKALEMPAG